MPFHSMTRQDIVERSSEGGVHVILCATGYELYYEALRQVTAYPSKVSALDAAHVLAQDHRNQYGDWTCDIYDYTSAPITED
jgi:hypothetical protein